MTLAGKLKKALGFSKTAEESSGIIGPIGEQESQDFALAIMEVANAAMARDSIIFAQDKNSDWVDVDALNKLGNLHPELVKRSVAKTSPDGKIVISDISNMAKLAHSAQADLSSAMTNLTKKLRRIQGK